MITTTAYEVNDYSNKRDVGDQPGTQWTLSSHKPGYGIDQLRDPDLNKLWQSDGVQPHLVNIQFACRTPISHVSIYLDQKRDDSYTPTKIAIKAGTHFHDLQEVRYREFDPNSYADSPNGWKHFVMDKADPQRAEEREAFKAQPPIYVHLLQISVLANHLNGKDTHVRSIRVYAPAVLDDLHGPYIRDPTLIAMRSVNQSGFERGLVGSSKRALALMKAAEGAEAEDDEQVEGSEEEDFADLEDDGDDDADADPADRHPDAGRKRNVRIRRTALPIFSRREAPWGGLR